MAKKTASKKMKTKKVSSKKVVKKGLSASRVTKSAKAKAKKIGTTQKADKKTFEKKSSVKSTFSASSKSLGKPLGDKTATKAPVVTLKPGMQAPDFDLPTETGKKLKLKDFFGKKLVLFFYPKDMTPGCTQEACDFRDSIQPLRAAGAEVLGISKDTVNSHEKFKTTYSLPFPLLADVEGKMCEAYGVWKEKSLYGRNYMGIERTTILVGSDGKILKIFEKVKVDGHVKEVLSAIQQAG